MITAVVVRTLGWLLVRRLIGLVGLGQGQDPRDVEVAVLRHQLTVVRRQVKRPRYGPGDRLVLAWLAGMLPKERWSVVSGSRNENTVSAPIPTQRQ